jgi:hypothetical protein
MSQSNISPSQKTAYKLGAVIAVMALIILMLPLGQSWQQSGPDNIGHGTVECEACHAPASGNPITQIPASAAHWLGMSDSPAWFISTPVANRQCLDCHENKFDRHPVNQFMEPEFADARMAIAPQFCVSCHTQHQGNRVSSDPEFCRHCHQELVMEEDPIDVPHQQLVQDQRWDTCMGCHDFHGNHEDDTPLLLAKMAARQQIEEYFQGGRSPYGYRHLTVMQTMKVKQE